MCYCCRYVSPDYASTGMLNEGSDVYSFGVLLMEIITGRSPVDYSRPPAEVKIFLFLLKQTLITQLAPIQGKLKGKCKCSSGPLMNS